MTSTIQLRKKLQLIAVAAAMATGGIHGALYGAPDAVLFFGDSAADQGNLFSTEGYQPGPNSPYFHGKDGLTRMSNGPIWTEVLFPGTLSVNSTSSLGKFVNFAYGGATTGANTFGLGSGLELPVGVSSQIDAYLSLSGTGALPKATAKTYAFIEAGPNDYFETLSMGGDPADTASASPRRLTDAAKRLATAGVRTIFVTETPDFAEAPLFADSGISQEAKMSLNKIAEQSRKNLRSSLTSLQTELGDKTRIVVLPLNSLYRAVINNPKAFGFTNVTGKIYDDSTDEILVGDKTKQDGYLFVDSLHLTAKAEKLQAKFYGEVISAIDGNSQRKIAQIAEGLRLDAAHLHEGLSEAMAGDLSDDKWHGYITGRAGLNRSSNEDNAQNRISGDLFSTIVGAKRKLSKTWQFGIGLGAFVEDSKIADRSLRWKTNGQGIWIQNRWAFDPVRISLDFGGAYLELNTKRDPSIPTFVSKGDTRGSIYTSRLEVERTLFQLTPSIRTDVVLGTSTVFSKTSAYDEKGASGLDLHIEGIDRNSIRSDVGLRLTGDQIHLGSVILAPSVDFLVAREYGDDTTDITVRLLGNTALPVRTSVSNGNKTTGAVRFNLVARFNDCLSAQFTNSYEASSNDGYESRVNFGVSARF